MRLKHFVIAAFIGIGLIGSQVSPTEATNGSHVHKQVHVQYKTFQDWNSFQTWCQEVLKGYQKHGQHAYKKEVYKKDKFKEAKTEQPQQPQQPAPPAKEEQPREEEQTEQGLTAEEQQMVNLVNQERESRGLQPLKANLELTEVARVKAQDMIDNNYFSHQSPTYGSPFDMMNHFGISYRTAGENLAGNQTVERAHQALMNSDGHRANILNANYTEVGIGIVDGGPYGKMFVQLFKG